MPGFSFSSGDEPSAGTSRSERGMSFGIQPTASSLKTKWLTVGAGGKRCVAGWLRIVTPHQPINSTTITVVTYMIFSASSDDSWMPCVLRHQKYTVMAAAIAAAQRLTTSGRGLHGWPK